MADNIETATSNTAGESFVEKIEEKLHLHHHDNPDDRHDNADGHHDSSSSSSSDSEPEKTTSSTGSTVTDKIYRLFGREKPVHQVLGGGKAADVCLWRNRKISASVLATATAIWVLFELLEYHLLTLVCHILIFSLAILFLWANATTFIHKSRPRIPEVSLPERPFLDFASAVTFEINRGFAILRQIASGRQLKKFLAAIAVLWVLSVLGSCYNFLTLLYTGFFLLHTVPVLYEKYEDKVDSFAEKASTEMKRGYAVANEKYLSKIPKGALKGKKLA